MILLIDIVLIQFLFFECFRVFGLDLEIGLCVVFFVVFLMYELGINVFKYGVWLNGIGMVLVSWEIECQNDQDVFILYWWEMGGLLVFFFQMKGFGLKLICLGFMGIGSVDFEYVVNGLCVEFRVFVL